MLTKCTGFTFIFFGRTLGVLDFSPCHSDWFGPPKQETIYVNLCKLKQKVDLARSSTLNIPSNQEEVCTCSTGCMHALLKVCTCSTGDVCMLYRSSKLANYAYPGPQKSMKIRHPPPLYRYSDPHYGNLQGMY